MYNALKSLLKMKSIFIITILQLAFGISLLNYVGGIREVSKNKIEVLERLFNPETTYLCRTVMASEEEHEKVWANGSTSYANLDKVIMELDKLKEKNIITNFNAYFTHPSRGRIAEKLTNKNFEDISIEEIYKYPTLIINESLASKVKAKILDGREIKSEDFKKDYKKENIPIWIGSDLAKTIKIGETFTENAAASGSDLIRVNITFEVVGVLEPNQFPSMFTSEELIGSIKYLNTMVVMPTVENFFDYNMEVALYDMGTFVELPANTDIRAFKKKFKTICSDAGYGATIISLKEDIENTLGNLDRELQQTVILGYLLTILSVVGIVSVMLGNMNRRYKEFGVKLSQGASIKIIMKELIYEVLISIIGAIILSFFFLFLKKFKTEFSIELLLRNIGFIIGISIIVIIPIILKIRKLNVVDLVRGK